MSMLALPPGERTPSARPGSIRDAGSPLVETDGRLSWCVSAHGRSKRGWSKMSAGRLKVSSGTVSSRSSTSEPADTADDVPEGPTGRMLTT